MFHHLQYKSDFVVGTDKEHSIFGLRSHSEKTHFSNMDLQFKCTLPTAVSRLCRGRFVPVQQHFDIQQSGTCLGKEGGLDHPEPRFDEVIVGTGVNGSIFGFRILDEGEFFKIFDHLKAVVAELAQYYAQRSEHRLGQILGRSNSFVDTTYPLQLGLVPADFGLSAILQDVELSSPRRSDLQRKSATMAEALIDSTFNLSSVARTSVSVSSIRHIDGDVMAYLNDLLIHMTSKAYLEGESCASSSDGANENESVSTHAYDHRNTIVYTAKNESFESHGTLQPKKWLDCYLDGISL